MRRPGAPSEEMRHKHAVTHFTARTVLLQEVWPGVSPCDNAQIPSSASTTVSAGAKVIFAIVSLCLLLVTSTGMMNADGEQSKCPTDKFAVEVRGLAFVAMLETLQTRAHSQCHDPQSAPVHVHESMGWVERIVQTVRTQTSTLVLQLQRNVGVELHLHADRLCRGERGTQATRQVFYPRGNAIDPAAS